MRLLGRTNVFLSVRLMRLWTCSQVMRAAHARGDVSFELADGSVLKGKLHLFWHSAERLRPFTTTFDLKSAYKQNCRSGPTNNERLSSPSVTPDSK